MKKIYRGLLTYASAEDDDVLALLENYKHTEILAEAIEWHIAKHGDHLTARYYISDVEIAANELVEKHLKTLYGSADAEYHVHYSEITGYLWTDEEINIGGHDLLSELKTHLGKWLHLEIEYSNND